MTSQKAQWIGVDWGTTSLRAWVFGNEEQPIEVLRAETGADGLSEEQFEPALLDLIEPFLGDGNTHVICCGAAGARNAWHETPYTGVPCQPLNTESAVKVSTSDPRLDIRILAGVSQSSPADVIRGEETQIAGYLSENPEFDGVLCLPGTHTKWVHISAGEIVSFRTFMTGEMFDLLASQSILRHSVERNGWNDIEFENAVADGMASPQMIAARLFGLRAEGVLNNLSPATALSRLSGYLIGIELAASKPYWLGQNVAVIGEPQLNALYAAALRVQDAPASLVSADRTTMNGLIMAHNAMF